ncbi:subtilisin-like protein, partial [Anaeromyces robustus]
QKYDNNYYYPSSAGKGIDIYFIDLGLQLNHPDFDTYKGTSDERTISCEARFYDLEYIDNRDGKYECNTQPMAFHGNMVASVAGGTLYGVAKKANLHMLDVDLTFGNEIIALDYIFKNGKPHKTIISISMIGNTYLEAYDDKIQDLINAGFIVIVAAGNYNSNSCYPENDERFMLPAGLKNVITVGATVDTIGTNMENIYSKASYSNYGECVDIHAPGQVIYASRFSDDFEIVHGTSCSTPLVAGVAA